MDITNPLFKESDEPLEFFLTTYTKDALNQYVNQLKKTFEAEYEVLNPLQWSDAELKYTYTSFNDDGIELNHEIFLAKILEDDLYDRSVLSIELIHQEYKNANKFGGLDSVDNYTQYLQAEISKCTALIAKISSFKFVEILYQPLDNIAEAISIYTKDIDLPSNEKSSIASVLFEWNVDKESVKLALSGLLFTLLIEKGLIHRNTRKKYITKAFSGSENKNYLSVQWIAQNPKNSEISHRALIFLIHSLSYKKLIKGDYPSARSTSSKIHTIFCKSDGSKIPLIALKHAKSEYLKAKISPLAHTDNPNFVKILEIIQHLDAFKKSSSGIR